MCACALETPIPIFFLLFLAMHLYTHAHKFTHTCKSRRKKNRSSMRTCTPRRASRHSKKKKKKFSNERVTHHRNSAGDFCGWDESEKKVEERRVRHRYTYVMVCAMTIQWCRCTFIIAIIIFKVKMKNFYLLDFFIAKGRRELLPMELLIHIFTSSLIYEDSSKGKNKRMLRWGIEDWAKIIGFEVCKTKFNEFFKKNKNTNLHGIPSEKMYSGIWLQFLDLNS